MAKKDVKKVVLAYSGGLDTSVILKWLQTEYACEVVTFTADLGQGEELEPPRAKAKLLGIKDANIFIEDLREEFVRDYVFPMFRANALYEGVYLLGTSIARPLIAKKQIEIAEKVGADAVAHGATGKGNDQVRFELSYYALKPDIKIIAPWREWDLTSRTKLLAFAEDHQIPIAKDKRGEAPFSVDANLLHSSSEGKVLEDPGIEADEAVYQRTISPEEAPDKATVVEIGFEQGDAMSVDGQKLSPLALLTKLNVLGKANGIGRIDLVENRFVGMKSRGIYETPGGTILHAAHRAIESITLDRGASHLKDELMPRYAELIYNGFWFSPEREMLQAAIDKSQEFVAGTVRLKLYKGNTMVIGRSSPHSLYAHDLVTFEDDRGAYDQKDAAGFIKLNALRLRTLRFAQAEIAEDMSDSNTAQVTYWNGPIGKAWAKEQAKRDRDHAPMTEAVLALAGAQPGESVLDIGCGSGTTTLLLAMRVAPKGRAIGIDLSAPMLDVARRRAESSQSIAKFIEADATTYAFDPGSLDLAFSQFGVMFFADPVATFANIRRALKPEGRLAFACWRGPDDHLWSTIPENAARPFLPPAAPVNFNGPGRFGFAKPERVRSVLSEAAAFRDVGIEKFDAPVFVGRTPEEAASSAIDAGPLMRTLADADEETRTKVRAAVAARLAQEAGPEGIFLNAAAWLVGARA